MTRTTSPVVLLLALLLTNTETVLGGLTVFPQDTQAIAGQSTKLSCSTNLPSNDIQWKYYPVGVNPRLPTSTPVFVYGFGTVDGRFRPRFQVEIDDSTGATNLFINQVNASDAGTYLCRDNAGAGESGSAQLIVLEPKAICKFNEKSNLEVEGCGKEPQQLELHCSVSFTGNSRPTLEWRKLGERTAISDGVRMENSSLVLTLKAALNMDRSSYVCVSTIPRVSSRVSSVASAASASAASASAASVTAAQYNCSSDGRQITCNSVTEPNSEECRFRSTCTPAVNNPTSTSTTVMMTVTTPVPAQFPLMPVVIAAIAVVIGALAVALIIIWQRHKKQIQAMVGRAEQLAFRRAPERISYRQEPIAIHTIHLVHSDERQQRRIRGVTVVGQDVFVVSSQCPEIVVYDSSSFTEKRHFDVPGLIDAWDIVSCPMSNNRLFVMDGKKSDETKPNTDKEIIRFEPSGDFKSSWSTKRKAGYLSVARDGNVVLAVYAKNVIVEYSPEGQQIRKIRINSVAGEVHPHHAFKLDTGHFVVIHGIGDSDLHRACIVNEDTGALVKTFGGKKGLGDGHMNLPKYLAVDSAGSVMVLDQNNNRVLLLGFDLQCQGELVRSTNGLLSPGKIHLNESSGRLFVTQSDSILVFDILQRSAVMPIL